MTDKMKKEIRDISDQLSEEYYKLKAVFYGIDCINDAFSDTDPCTRIDTTAGFIYIGKDNLERIYKLYERLDKILVYQ